MKLLLLFSNSVSCLFFFSSPSSPGWLEPLLDRIARDPQTVVCPVIDVIDDDTLEFHYRDSSGVNVGGFDWNLQVRFKRGEGGLLL